MSADDEIIKLAAKSVNERYLKKPYVGTANKNNRTYRCSNGTIIHRPNHGLAHSLRKMSYADAVLNYLKHHGITEPHKRFIFTDEECLAIKLSLLFSVTGRDDEAGHSDSPKAYQRYLDASAKNFEDFCLVKAGLSSQIIDRFKKIIVAKHDSKNTDPARLVVHMCHELDLLRCFPPEAVQAHFASLNRKEVAAFANNRDFTQLVLYAQECIEKTGDCLTTKFKKNNGRVLNLDGWFRSKLSFSMPFLSFNKRDDSRFEEFSTSVEKCMDAIAGVALPDSFVTSRSNTTETRAEEARANNDSDVFKETKGVLDLIKETKAAVRLVNLQPGQEDDFAFEMRTICDPINFRSTKPSHSESNIGDRSHYLDQRTSQYRNRPKTKEYVPIEQQPFIDTNPPRSKYYDIKGNPIVRPIHEEKDRGKPKNTIFAKKKAFSLLRPDGKHLHFKGTTFKRSTFMPVGMINDVTQMHLHGEQYIWKKDVCTDDKFWTGDKAKPKDNVIKEALDDTTQCTVQKCIDMSERKKGISLNELQNDLNTQSKNKAPVGRRNEMLIGPSKKSLRAIFAPEDTVNSRLNTLYANLLLQEDYGKQVPMLIIDGEQPPKAYTPRKVQKDLANLVRKYATPSPWVAVKQLLGFAEEGKSLYDVLSRLTGISPSDEPNKFISSLLEKVRFADDMMLKDRSDIQLESNWKWIYNHSPLKLTIELFKTLATATAALICLLPLTTYTVLAAVTTAFIAPFMGLAKGWEIATRPLAKLCAYFIFPSRSIARKPLEPMPAVEGINVPFDLDLKTRDGLKLEAVQVNPKDFTEKPSEQKYIICINGRDSLFADDDRISQMQKDAEATSAAVIAFNMPGLGKSKGSSSTAARLLEVSTDIVNALIDEKGVKSENIVLKGHSLGGGIASLTAANLHKKGRHVRLFVDRSFSTLTNVLHDKVSGVWGAGYLFKLVFNYFLSLAGWNIDSATAWHTIPAEYKEYVTIQGRAGHKAEEKRYDGIITDGGALHNDPKIKQERKNAKEYLEQLRYYPEYRGHAEAKLVNMKRSKMVKIEAQKAPQQLNLPTGSHNLSLCHLRLRGTRETTAAVFFQTYAKKKPEEISGEQRVLEM